MLNFDCKIIIKTDTYELKNNKVFKNGTEIQTPYDLTSHSGNAIIKVYQDTILKQSLNHLNSISFKELVKECWYRQAAYNTMLDLKKACCRYGYSKTFEDFKALEIFNFRGHFAKAINYKRFSYAEMLVLEHILENNPEKIEYYNVDEHYNPVTDSYAKITKIFNDVVTFDYAKYGVGYSEKVTSFIDTYNSFEQKIATFRNLIKEAGNEILIWSQMKITRRLHQSNRDYGYWSFSEWLNSYKQNLKETGVVVEEKETKLNKIKTKNGKTTDEETLCIFKQGTISESFEIIDKMSLAAVQEIFRSNLKVVAKKLNSMFGQWSKNQKKFVDQAILGTTKEDHSLFMSFVGKYDMWGHLTPEYLIKNKEFVSTEEFVNYARKTSSATYASITVEKLSFFLNKLPQELRYTLNSYTSDWFLAKASETEKLELLKALTKEA